MFGVASRAAMGAAGAAAAMPPQDYAAHVMALGPVAYWPAGETSGATVADVIGSNHATLEGTFLRGRSSLVTGSDMPAFQLKGSGKLTIPNAVIRPGDTPLTHLAVLVSFVPHVLGDQHQVLDFEHHSSTVSERNGFALDWNNGRLRAFARNASGGVEWVTGSGGFLDLAECLPTAALVYYGPGGFTVWVRLAGGGVQKFGIPTLTAGLTAAHTDEPVVGAWTSQVLAEGARAFGLFQHIAVFDFAPSDAQAAQMLQPREARGHDAPILDPALPAVEVVEGNDALVETIGAPGSWIDGAPIEAMPVDIAVTPSGMATAAVEADKRLRITGVEPNVGSVAFRLQHEALFSSTSSFALPVLGADAPPPDPDFQGIGPDPEVVAALQVRTIPTQGTTGYVDSENGSDSNSGTEASPWQTVAKALSEQRRNIILRGTADPNNPRRYFESNLNVNYSGTASIPGRIMAFPGEFATVDGRKAGADFTGFGVIGNSLWTQSGLSSADINRGIWRSTGTFSVSSGNTSNPNVMGWYEDNHPFRPGKKIWIWLVPVVSMTQLRRDGLDYFGPGIFHDTDNRIYIRLARPHTFRKLYPTDLPSGPLVGGHPDPRQKRIHIFRQHTSHQCFEMRGSNWVFDGIGVESYVTGWQTFTSINNVNFRGGHTDIMKRVVLGNHTWNGLLAEGVYWNLGFPWYTSWGETKSGSSTPLTWMQSGTSFLRRNNNSMNNIEIRHSELSRGFDVFTCTSQMSGFHCHHCNVESLDDLHHIGESSSHVEVAYNILKTNAYCGMDGTSSTSRVGSWFWHHNVLDWRLEQLWGRTDGGAEALNRSVLAIQSGHGSPNNRPIWFYHNTILMARQNDPLSKRWGVGTNPVTASLSSGTYYEPNSAFNNIIVVSDDPTSDADYMLRARREHAQGSMHRQDGNIYGRPTVAAGGGSLTRTFYINLPRTSGGSTSNFTSLAAFKSSAHFNDTKNHYPPGWDNSSREVTGSMAQILNAIGLTGLSAPGFWDSDYRPAPGSLAASGAINLTGFRAHGNVPLPGMAQHQPWVGALPAAGS